MTPEELAAIEARAAVVAQFVSKHDPVVARKGTITVSNGPFSIYQAFKIAEFYNRAHTDIPALCAEIRRLHEVINGLSSQ